MPAGNIAIIGGTGFDQLPPDIYADSIVVSTRFGPVPMLSLSNNYVEPYKLYFLARHGPTHGIAPHQINYLANTAALVDLNVKSVFATNAVGSLREDLIPGSLMVFDNFIDFTRTRPYTFFTQNDEWRHVDFSIPYSAELRGAIRETAAEMGLPVIDGGTYLCCEGPRFESPAEVRMFRSWGADVVGMTGLPEAVFAREASIDYAAVGIVTNLGAGLTVEPVAHEAVVSVMREIVPTVRELLTVAAGRIIEQAIREG